MNIEDKSHSHLESEGSEIQEMRGMRDEGSIQSSVEGPEKDDLQESL